VIDVLFVGSGAPLEKCLDVSFDIDGIKVICVYTNFAIDHAILRKCRNLEIKVGDFQELEKDKFDPSVISTHDYLINVNSTILFPKELLCIASQGALNMHPGRLPDYAGLHTHQWAIRNGEKTFASSLHWMAVSVDTGPIVFEEHFDISPRETGILLYMKCLRAGAHLVVRALELIAKGEQLPAKPQDLSQRNLYTDKQAQQSYLDWKLNPREIERFIRAADYRPFESPTYKPILTYKGNKYLLTKAEISNYNSSLIVGEVIAIDTSGLHVSTGGQKALAITGLKKLSAVSGRYESHSTDLFELGVILSNEKI